VIVAILPRLDGPSILPQTAAMFARFTLGCGEFADLLVLGVVPTVSFPDLVEIDVVIAHINSAAIPAFGIDFDGVKPHGFVVNLRVEALPGRLPVSLASFWRIDAIQADAVAPAFLVRDDAGIAIFDRDDAALDRATFQPSLVAIFRPELTSQAREQGNSKQRT
jgi:hypothetical protein